MPERSALWRVYRSLGWLLQPAAEWGLRRRVAAGREDPQRWGERLGRTRRARPDGDLVWLHGVSVGETLALLPLVERLRAERPDVTVLVTSSTVASANLLAQRVPPGVFHQFAPIDTPAAVGRFLDHWRPAAGVFIESEIWPNLILDARRRGVRLALVSARFSAASLDRWSGRARAAAELFSAFECILARDSATAKRLSALGGRVVGTADLKFGAPPLPADEEVLATLRGELADRPILLAASTHPGEEAGVLTAFAPLAERALLILVPRHLERGAAIEALARQAGLGVARRSRGESPAVAPVYLADTLGELGLWFRLARLAFIGGSLVEGVGGHNPLEPARLNCPFIAGPFTAAWPVYKDLLAAGAMRRVADPSELASAFRAALGDTEPLTAQTRAARTFVEAGDRDATKALDTILAMVPA